MAQRKQYSAEFRPRNRVDVRLHRITSVAVPVQCWGLHTGCRADIGRGAVNVKDSFGWHRLGP